MRPVRARVDALLTECAASEAKKARGMCARILTLRGALWTFVRVARGHVLSRTGRDGVERVEPTLRQRGGAGLEAAGVRRKLGFGSASDRGSRMLRARRADARHDARAAATCREHGRNVLDYLAAASEAHARGELAPSLLPQPAEDRLAA